MKKYTVVLLALALMVCSGCPIGLDYPLAPKGEEKIERELIGTWVAEAEDPEVKKVSLKSSGDNTYEVEVLEKGSMYSLETDKLEAWVTTVNKGNFLILKPEGEDKFYHYQFHFNGNKLVTNDVSLVDGGVDAVTSTETLRNQVERSMGMEGWADENISWNKE